MIRIGLLLSGLLGASSAVAHHAAAGLYDRSAIGEIEGAITSIFWRNPHVRLGITRVNENGEDEAKDRPMVLDRSFPARERCGTQGRSGRASRSRRPC